MATPRTLPPRTLTNRISFEVNGTTPPEAKIVTQPVTVGASFEVLAPQPYRSLLSIDLDVLSDTLEHVDRDGLVAYLSFADPDVRQRPTPGVFNYDYKMAPSGGQPLVILADEDPHLSNALYCTLVDHSEEPAQHIRLLVRETLAEECGRPGRRNKVA